ncbi:hypothetical protein GE253_21735 [Niveispirillum sp. SYP-B3756]|uniref:hypothetical protein n=1 Tax=Niveispirillum sp. SYP-B3756 TaxID=2662178 RepID=UPI001290F6B8|nr:hypothetical protein [Niveispirillum sp. SYP-B3756]MQP67943.1 hypothetical protein [Niveispirillum sp. SYP-B3756]
MLSLIRPWRRDDAASAVDASLASPLAADNAAIIERAALAVARRFARGNVAAQHGRILTASRLEQEREQLRRDMQLS